jgi:hemoglobin
MYPQEDFDGAEERLTMFLVQYWGGPNTYSQKRGHPRLILRHRAFHVNPEARHRWLAHMRHAMDVVQLAPIHEATLWDYLHRSAFALVNTFDPTPQNTPPTPAADAPRAASAPEAAPTAEATS